MVSNGHMSTGVTCHKSALLNVVLQQGRGIYTLEPLRVWHPAGYVRYADMHRICVILYCIILYYIVLYCIILYYVYIEYIEYIEYIDIYWYILIYNDI